MKDVEIALEYKDSWTVDTRAVRIPATGGRILRHRPLFADWRLSFELDLDETILSPVMLRQLVDDAGSKIGLGDFRPDTKGPFGKFKVVLWENLDEVRPRKRRAGLGKAGRGHAGLG